MWRKQSPLTATIENSTEIPHKIQNKTTKGPSLPLLGMYSKKPLIQKDTYICMFITALITIAKT